MRGVAARTAPPREQGLSAWRRVTPASTLAVGLISVPWLLWILASWPGNFTEDSLGTNTDIRLGRYDDTVPVTYMLYAQEVAFGDRFILGVTLVQCALVSAALYVLGRSLGAKRRVAVAIVEG
jgi:hypothetical protein